jgi:hypothetical protein
MHAGEDSLMIRHVPLMLVIEKYFDRSVWSDSRRATTSIKGKSVQDLCQRKDLMGINSVKDR